MYNKAEIIKALGVPAGALLPTAVQPCGMGAWQTQQRACVQQRAAQYLESPTPLLPYRLFRLYWETGDRTQFQNVYYERRGRLLTFSLMVLFEPSDDLWLHALEDILWEICAEPFWCLPAHFMDAAGAPLPFEAYATQLDLFSCETGFALAECLALHETRLAPDVVRQVELQLEQRVFVPFLNGDICYRFETMSNNWSGVCGSAIGGAALYRLKDTARLATILHRCLSCLDVYLASFGNDGICVEGVDYWTYGFGFYTCFAALLEQRTAGALNLFAGEKVQAIACSQQQYRLTGAYTVSFADGSETASFRMGLSCFLQRRFPALSLPEAHYAAPVLADGCYRFCLALRDFLWTDSTARLGLSPACGVWLPNAQWFLSRGDTLVLAAKAGNNGESHNHNDCGSLILCKDGEPLLCDLGAGVYDAAYFGPHRYDIFVNASRSHNVPLVDGAQQCAGASAAAREVSFSLGEEDTLSMELSACYPVQALRELRRVIVHQRAARRVCLTDTFHFSTPCAVTESFLSHLPIRLTTGGAVFTGEKTALRLTYDEQLFAGALREEPYVDRLGAPRTAFLLHLTARVPQESLCCAIVLE